jgi:hypothetical protein
MVIPVQRFPRFQRNLFENHADTKDRFCEGDIIFVVFRLFSLKYFSFSADIT